MDFKSLREKFLEFKKWKNYEQKKENFSGPGPFVDKYGQKNITGNEIFLKWNRSKLGSAIMTFAALFWCSISFGMVWALVINDAPIKVNNSPYSSFSVAFADHPWLGIFAIFPIIGVILLYSAICTWVNKTSFKFDGRYLSVTHGPLPFSGSKKLSVSSLEQLFTQMYKKTVSSNGNRRTVTYYRLKARLRDGTEQTLFDKAPLYSEVRILEQWIESKLGIEDQEISGEVA